MKKLSYYFSVALLGAAVLATSCKKKEEDPAPIIPANAKVFTSNMSGTNGGSSGTAIMSGNVTTADGSAILRLEVNHTGSNNLQKIYITKTEDNGEAKSYVYPGNLKSGSIDFNGNSTSETFDISGATKSFVLEIPVSVRNTPSAVTDVYQIWITDGNGGFDRPTKNRVLGLAKITLKYVANATGTFTTFSAIVGDQQNNSRPSFIVTTGQGGVISQGEYNNVLDPENAGSVDISFASLTSDGAGLGVFANLLSPDQRGTVGFINEPDASNTNTTFFGAWSGTAFASVTAADLSSIGALSDKNIAIVDNGTYAFVTEKGKKGLLKVNGAITAEDGGKKFSFIIKVLN